jgi:hypothetical protein
LRFAPPGREGSSAVVFAGPQAGVGLGAARAGAVAAGAVAVIVVVVGAVAVIVVVVGAVAVIVGVVVVDVVVGVAVVDVAVVSAGGDVCGTALPVVVEPGAAVLADSGALAAAPPTNQPLAALDMASVPASTDSRERQPARGLYVRRLRCI